MTVKDLVEAFETLRRDYPAIDMMQVGVDDGENFWPVRDIGIGRNAVGYPGVTLDVPDIFGGDDE